MKKTVKRVVVTGSAGQIAYNLLFRIGSGELLGQDQPVALHLLELPEALPTLEGVVMELEDCAFPLLKEIRIGSNPYELFQGVHYALLIGAKPRSAGMERKDLLLENGKIFIEQGKALNEGADPQVKVLVVGNPCNTNCWIAMHHAPKISRKNFHAMTRLDHNRAVSQLAKKLQTDLGDIENVTIWGNHSSTQVPDFVNAHVKGVPILQKFSDRSWFEKDFVSLIQQRGAAIIAKRGKSSAASAASAIVDTIHALINPTPPGTWFSSAVCSDGNPYGVEEDLIFSFPCRLLPNGEYEIVPGIPWDFFLSEKIKATEQELMDERAIVLKEIKLNG